MSFGTMVSKKAGFGIFLLIVIVIIIAVAASRNTGPLIARIEYDGSWEGSFSNGGGGTTSHSGNGNRDVPIDCEGGIFSVVVQKGSLGSGGVMTVKVMRGNDVLAQDSTGAQYGVVSLSGGC